MKQVPDRNKLRREYLRKKRTTYCKQIVLSVGIMASLGIVTLLIYYGHPVNIGMQIWLAIFAIVLVHIGWQSAHKEAKLIPYVPPITPDTLPAEEALVRGSEQPTIVQSEVLLRAAKAQETPKEELLRVSQE